MEPEAKNQDLLYVSDEQTCDVYVFSYREGNLVGTLTSGIGFNAPGGECVDKRGDIFITNGNATHILEFAHGGTTPIQRLKDARGGPLGCAVDPKTGDLAVTNWLSRDRKRMYAGSVVIYKGATGSIQRAYTAPGFDAYYWPGYDSKGDLFVDGLTASNTFVSAVRPEGATSFSSLTLNRSISYPGGVQSNNGQLAIADAYGGVIYQFQIAGTKGTWTGTTTLNGVGGVLPEIYDRSVEGSFTKLRRR